MCEGEKGIKGIRGRDVILCYAYRFDDILPLMDYEEINNLLPISLKYLNDLIDRVHSKYPMVDKPAVALVTRTFFEVLRYLLISNNTIAINKLIPRMKLIEFTKINKNKLIREVKVKLATPESMK